MAEFTFFNTSGELTLSADGITYGYIGKATLSSVTQPYDNGSFSVNGSVAYTANWAAEIIVVLPLRFGKGCAVLGVNDNGNGTWGISIFASNGQENSGFDMQEAIDVYVFGAPIPGSTSVINLFDANGVVCADLTRRPLMYAGVVSFATSQGASAMPLGVSVSGVIGGPRDFYSNGVRRGATSLYDNYNRLGAWMLENDVNGVTRLVKEVFLTRHWVDDGPAANTSDVRADTAIIVELAGL